jgi:hypothetical protein
MTHAIIIFVTIVLLGIVFYYTNYLKEGFANLPSRHNNYTDESAKKFNPIANTVNLINPIIPLTPSNASLVKNAFNSIDLDPRSANYNVTSGTEKYDIPSDTPDVFKTAKKCESVPVSCSAFDDATFANNCGMSFDTQGTNSDGKEFLGGLYVAPSSRVSQQTDSARARDQRQNPYLSFQPTIGTAKPGTFALTKDDCIIVKEKVDCEKKQTFDSPNCTQCYTSREFARVGPEAQKIPFTLYLQGYGRYQTQGVINPEGDKRGSLPFSPNVPVKLTVDRPEGNLIAIFASPPSGTEDPKTHISGYIEGNTPKGTFKLDLLHIVEKDFYANKKPRISGTVSINGFRCARMIPNKGQRNNIVLLCQIPFSFINTNDYEAGSCANGPVITKASSAIFLNSDACFNKDNKPGNYSLECLQSRWLAMGGTSEGTGYPSDKAKADALQINSDGSPLPIETIIDNLSIIMLRAQTGKDAAGKQLSIDDWNTSSMFATGTPITNPCDTENADSGPLSKECLSYLYMNQGNTSRIGPTYDLPSWSDASMKGQPDRNTYCQPGTSLDPNTDAGFKLGQTLGGVEQVKKYYNQINRIANDDSRSNKEREKEIKQCYGVSLNPVVNNATPGPKQVFAVGPGYDYTRDQAAQVCAGYGAQVATKAQLAEAQTNGADWCFSAWVNDSPNGQWPITTSVIGGCGGRQGIIEWTPDNRRAGVNCYGPKPAINTVMKGAVKPFNGTSWDQPSGSGYTEVPNGYLQTTGPQPACFNGLSPEQAQQGCNRLGDLCAGFSYSKDGGGHGCYKGNHNAGLINDPGYMGYVKTPLPKMRGRYIKLQYNRVECLNLAEIRVFSTSGGPNIINRNTPVTKSSGFNGDAFPSRNFVDGDTGQTYNFVHTSCGDVPWIVVDLNPNGQAIDIFKIVVFNRADCCQSRILGTVLEIYNEGGTNPQSRVYVSEPIRTTNRTYTWFPPSPVVIVDQP